MLGFRRGALKLLRQQDYATIISDVRMPHRSGFALLEHVGKIRPCAPVILFTGNRELTQAEDAMNHGAFDFLFKPLDRDEFVQVVNRALQIHELCHVMGRQRTRVMAISQRMRRIEGCYSRFTSGNVQVWRSRAPAVS